MEETVTRRKEGIRRQAVKESIAPNWKNPSRISAKKKEKGKERGVQLLTSPTHAQHRLWKDSYPLASLSPPPVAHPSHDCCYDVLPSVSTLTVSFTSNWPFLPFCFKSPDGEVCSREEKASDIMSCNKLHRRCSFIFNFFFVVAF